MTKQKIVILILSILFIISLTGAIIYFLETLQLKKRNMELITEIGNKIPLEHIDSNTVRKTGLEINSEEMKEFIIKNRKEILNILNIRSQTAKEYIETKIQYVYDTIHIKGDTTYIQNGVEYGSGEKKDKWYYIKASWTCNPYLLDINKILFNDRIITVPYETENEKGVYIYNENPNAIVDSVNYYWTKENKSIFGISAGIFVNKSMSNKVIFINPTVKQHGLLIGFDVKDFTNLTVDNLMFGYTYKFK